VEQQSDKSRDCPEGVDAVEKCGFSVGVLVLVIDRLTISRIFVSGLRFGRRDASRVTSREYRARRWRPMSSKREGFEVLHNGGEMEFVTRAGKSSEPHLLEAVVGLQAREAHLDTLSFVSRPSERLCLHLLPRDIAGVLMEIAWDFTRVGCGAALRSDRAHVAIPLRGAVEQRASVVHGSAGPEQLQPRNLPVP
jgi:hypothetical protein